MIPKMNVEGFLLTKSAKEAYRVQQGSSAIPEVDMDKLNDDIAAIGMDITQDIFNKESNIKELIQLLIKSGFSKEDVTDFIIDERQPISNEVVAKIIKALPDHNVNPKMPDEEFQKLFDAMILKFICSDDITLKIIQNKLRAFDIELTPEFMEDLKDYQTDELSKEILRYVYNGLTNKQINQPQFINPIRFTNTTVDAEGNTIAVEDTATGETITVAEPTQINRAVVPATVQEVKEKIDKELQGNNEIELKEENAQKESTTVDKDGTQIEQESESKDTNSTNKSTHKRSTNKSTGSK